MAMTKKQREQGLAVLKRKLRYDGYAEISEELARDLWPERHREKSTEEKVIDWAEQNAGTLIWNETLKTYIFEAHPTPR